jgi:hypothetical protein
MKQKRKTLTTTIFLLALLAQCFAQPVSQSHYFDWINSQYEGTTEEQAIINLDFFKWMHDTYGMKLDIYSLDVGNMDDGPRTAGVGRLSPYHYGNLESREYNEQFPNGFGPLAKKAAEFDCRLGLWLGPGGFGKTDKDSELRKEMMVSMCRDHDFRLFKMDAVAGQFDKSEENIMIETLEECRKYTPDLIVSSHRVDFGRVEPLITHKLWAGVETYVDVFINNNKTASHHREGSLERGLTPGMDRMYEDHGVCLSSCLDYWEDELVLQAFNRSLILAPQIYGNPWFLRDDEYPKMARIFNLHRKYRERIIEGFQLDSAQYGPYAVSRGDGRLRFITLRNNTWEPVHYNISLNENIGLDRESKVDVRMFHPWEENLGSHSWGETISVEVLPFRTCLIAAGEKLDEPGLPEGPFRLIPALPGKEARVIPLEVPERPYHYHITTLVESEVPGFAESLFEATCFAADNNALEVRSLERSGTSEIPQVVKAREAFVNKPMFVNRAIWDKNLFDGDIETFFTSRLEGRMLRLDFGMEDMADEVIIRIRDRQYPELNPELERFSDDTRAEVSADLISWREAILESGGSGTIARVRILDGSPVRYLRVKGAPRRIAEIEAYYKGAELDRSEWRASNLFPDYAEAKAVKAFKADFSINYAAKGSYLCLALNGIHGHEKAWAALRVDGEFIGAPDRAVSFDSNTWEYFNVEMDRDYTYYFPVDESFVGSEIEAWVIILDGGSADIRPELWMTAYPIPWKVRE